MTRRTDLFDSTYSHFSDSVLAQVRAETFDRDIGQNSWLTADEFERFVARLELAPAQHVLEVASGAGGPACELARRSRCQVTGIDSNEHGIATARRAAEELGLAGQVRFEQADASAALPFADASFDALLCIDSMTHFPDRPSVLREWRRVLRPGGRALFTDPVVITGAVSNAELALRSSIGFFLFVPPGVNERMIEDAGLRLAAQEDATANAALVSGRWHRARAAHRAELLRIEGEERFEGLQRFFEVVERLTRERRLSRFAYLVERPRG